MSDADESAAPTDNFGPAGGPLVTTLDLMSDASGTAIKTILHHLPPDDLR